MALRTTIGGDGVNDAAWHQGQLVVGGGGRPPLNNDEATFEGGGGGIKDLLDNGNFDNGNWLLLSCNNQLG
jgi:hypothetical protein